MPASIASATIIMKPRYAGKPVPKWSQQNQILLANCLVQDATKNVEPVDSPVERGERLEVAGLVWEQCDRIRRHVGGDDDERIDVTFEPFG